jgi:hypothetical protein
VGRGAWGVGRGAWGVGRGAWGVGALGVGAWGGRECGCGVASAAVHGIMAWCVMRCYRRGSAKGVGIGVVCTGRSAKGLVEGVDEGAVRYRPLVDREGVGAVGDGRGAGWRHMPCGGGRGDGRGRGARELIDELLLLLLAGGPQEGRDRSEALGAWHR